MATNPINDLVILAADRGIHETIDALLKRYQSLRIQKIDYRILSQHSLDSKCYHRAHLLLQPFTKQFSFALVVFDRKDCGKGDLLRISIEEDVENRLFQNGWKDRAAAIAIDPELEMWVWSDSSKVDEALGWEEAIPMRKWLISQNLLETETSKPADPKEAYQTVLRKVNKKPSNAIFKEIAQRVSLTRCTDPAFQKLKTTLQTWFPEKTEV